MWLWLGIGFLAFVTTVAFVAYLLGYTVKFDNMEMDNDD